MDDVTTKKILDRASRISEEWSGTLVSGMIEYRKIHLQELEQSGDKKLVSIQLLELAELCDEVEGAEDGYA